MMQKIDLWSVLVANREMKPLLANQLSAFTQRFSDFTDAEFRTFELLSPTSMRATFALQDAGREYDWITLALEFNDVRDASLIYDEQLHLVDISEGATLQHGDTFEFSIKQSTFFIKAKTLKYQEGTF